VNAFVFTLFLWHMIAVLLLVGLLAALGALPTPVAGTVSWWLWRVPWFAMLAVLLVAIVAVVGRVELRGARQSAAGEDSPMRPSPRLTPATRLVVTLAAFGAVIWGLVANNLAPDRQHHLVGMPLSGLVAYLAGAGVLRLLRSMPAREGVVVRPAIPSDAPHPEAVSE
jgi:hypothetical protein